MDLETPRARMMPAALFAHKVQAPHPAGLVVSTLSRHAAVSFYLQIWSFESISSASVPLGMVEQLAPEETLKEFQIMFLRQTG